MDVRSAYALLVLKPEADLDEAKKVFDKRALELRSDRFKGRLRPAAESAMAEVDEAWYVVWRHLRSGGGSVPS
jgi:curved DNA-binding protein CbpA